MARGLLNVGEEYESMATKGFIRADELEEEINMANKEISAQSRMQKQKMGMELGMLGGVGGWMAGAEIGAGFGPAGMVAGAALGFLVSKLF